jgi:3-deoxy-D-manno-octulosonic-acid transferase
VYVADRLGELGLWLRLARAVFVGGSLEAGVGGHNPLEPARLDCPLAAGPRVANWMSVYADLDAAGGLAWVRDAGELGAFWSRAVDDDPGLRRQAAAARALAERGTDALDQAVARLLQLLP